MLNQPFYNDRKEHLSFCPADTKLLPPACLRPFARRSCFQTCLSGFPMCESEARYSHVVQTPPPQHTHTHTHTHMYTWSPMPLVLVKFFHLGSRPHPPDRFKLVFLGTLRSCTYWLAADWSSNWNLFWLPSNILCSHKCELHQSSMESMNCRLIH